mgnify:CR=1 FL=1
MAVNNMVYEIKKQIDVTNLMQLIDINGTKKNLERLLFQGLLILLINTIYL